MKWLETIAELDCNKGLKQSLQHYAVLAHHYNCAYVSIIFEGNIVTEVNFSEFDHSIYENRASFKRTDIYYNKKLWA